VRWVHRNVSAQRCPIGLPIARRFHAPELGDVLVFAALIMSLDVRTAAQAAAATATATEMQMLSQRLASS
jgi:hypothetical protein